jgi:hypothetical protein
MVEMGTFVAALAGQHRRWVIIAVPAGPHYVAAGCLLLASAGRVVSQFIPAAATDPG